MKNIIWVSIASISLISGCVTPDSASLQETADVQKNIAEEVASSSGNQGKAQLSELEKVQIIEREKAQLNKFKQEELLPYQIKENHCQLLTVSLPFVMSRPGVFVTDFKDKCVTLDGGFGFSKNSDFNVLVIPGALYPAQLEMKGSFYNPKMVLMHLMPSGASSFEHDELLQKDMAQNFGYTEPKKPLSANPFMLQFWYLEDLKTAGDGASMSWVVPESSLSMWQKFYAGKISLKVVLWGRESTWKKTPLLKISGSLSCLNGTQFKLTVDKIGTLDAEERQQDMNFCTKSMNVMSCQKIFVSN